jgi:hypothetical protein
MRKSLIEMAALSLVFVVAATSPGQGGGKGAPSGEGPEPAKKSALEEALEKALKSNPDLRVAAAKVNEAEALLNRAQLQVVQKVVAQYRAIRQAKLAVQEAQVKLQMVRRIADAKGVPAGEISQAEIQLERAKAALADIEAEMDYLTGKISQRKPVRFVRNKNDATEAEFLSFMRMMGDGGNKFREKPIKPQAIEAKMADRIRKVLNQRHNYDMERPVEEAITLFRNDLGNIHLQLVRGGSGKKLDGTIKLKAENMSFGAALQLLEDVMTTHCVVVREYGLLITPRDKVPPGAILLDEFWKGSEKAAPAKSSETPKK